MRPIDGDALKITLDTFATLVGFGGVYDRGQVMECIDAAMTVATDTDLLGKWMSVEDGLPDAAGYECLVCAVNENTHQTHVFTAFTGYGEPGWWTSNVNYMSRAKSPSDNSLHPALRVTHWMPLPKPPKEVTGDDA